MQFSPGDLIDKKFKIERELGSGATGTVYLCTDPHLGRMVAVKVLRFATAQGDTQARFEREARALNQLLHANIIRVYRYGTLEDSSSYLVMEYFEGESLRLFLERETPLSCQQAVTIALQLASALEYAHNAKIVHRDLKPENLLIKVENGTLTTKLLDFGLCKQDDENSGEKTLTQTGSILGTALYMSPEQCMGKKSDWRTDIYSFGCILFELVTGAPPFIAESQAEVLLKHLSEPMPAILELAPGCGLPVELQDLIIGCGSKNKESRPQSFAEIRERLSSIEQLNCNKFFDRHSTGKNLPARIRRLASKIPPQFLRNSAIVAALSMAAAAAFLCLSSQGQKMLGTEIQRLLNPSEASKSLTALVTGFLEAGKLDSARNLIQSSTSSRSFKSWSSLDQENLLKNYIEILKTHKLDTDVFQLKLVLLDKLFSSVQNQLLKPEKDRSRNIDQAELGELEKLSHELLQEKHSKHDWSQISQTLENRWSPQCQNGVLWLNVLRCMSWRRRGLAEEDRSELAKYYLTAAGLAKGSREIQLMKDLCKEALDFAPPHRRVSAHQLLGHYYLEAGDLLSARRELKLAQEAAGGEILSGSEEGGLKELELWCREGKINKLNDNHGPDRSLPAVYRAVLDKQN